MRWNKLAPFLILSTLLSVSVSASSIHTTDPRLEVAKGNDGVAFLVNKFGHNSDVDAPNEVVSSTAAYWQPIAASALEFIAGATDTAAGVGCQNVCIQGLDENYNRVTECEDSIGVSASTATTATYTRVYRAWCDRAGTYGGNNVGIVTMRISGGGATVAIIELGSGQTEIAAYSVPAGFTCYGRNYQYTCDEVSAGVEGLFFGYFNIDDVVTPFSGAKRLFVHLANISGPGAGARVSEMPYAIPEKTDIVCTAAAGSNSEVSCTFELECYPN